MTIRFNAPVAGVRKIHRALMWDTAYLPKVLQGADVPVGPWTEVPGATSSPYLLQPVEQKKIIRVIQR